MQKTTKLLRLLLVFVAVFTLTGCGEKNIEGKLSDIMTNIYSDINQDEMPMLDNFDVLEVAPDNIEYYIGTSDIEYSEIYASEPMMSSVAYSVVLVRMKDGADIEEAKTKIKENVDPRKWLCVEVAKEDVIVKSKGDLIILVMVENEATRTKIVEGFDNL